MEEDVHLTFAQFIGTSYFNPLNLSSILNYSKVAFVNSCILLTNLFPFPLFYFLPLFVPSLAFLLFFTVVNMFYYYLNYIYVFVVLAYLVCVFLLWGD